MYHIISPVTSEQIRVCPGNNLQLPDLSKNHDQLQQVIEIKRDFISLIIQIY
jgi:hypothetical protein